MLAAADHYGLGLGMSVEFDDDGGHFGGFGTSAEDCSHTEQPGRPPFGLGLQGGFALPDRRDAPPPWQDSG